METKRLRGDVEADVATATALLRANRVVALPTETVYGLAARGLNEQAVRAIFLAKQRPADNPLILHVDGPDAALALWHLSSTASAFITRLATAFWPGPLTVVAPKTALVPDVVCAGGPTVAIRVPAHPLMLEVLKRLGEPLAAPSANASGRPSPTTATDVLQSLDGRIDAVLDGGPSRFGLESTVVDVSGPQVRVLRLGAITTSAIEHVVGPIEATVAGNTLPDAAAPGLKHQHYRPRIASVRLAAREGIDLASDDALLLFSDQPVPSRAALTVQLPRDPVRAGAELYAALYRLERAQPLRLVIEEPPRTPQWEAIWDRLLRAARG